MYKNGTAYVTLDEQETVIQFSRCDNYANISTSDSTMKTKYDRLCRENPQHWVCISDKGVFATYRCTPKSLISARSKTTTREFTPEQKRAMAERLAASRRKTEQK